MDPSRHHDFLSNNEDRNRAAYYGREIPEITSHHYYAPTTTTTRTVSSSSSNTRKPCGCSTTIGSVTTAAGNITCNGCRLPTNDGGWPTIATTNQTEHTQRSGGGVAVGMGDYGRMAAETAVRTNMRQSPMFLQNQQQQQQQTSPHGPPPPPSLVQPQHSQSHMGNMGGARSNYWPPQPSSSSSQQSFNEDNMGGIPSQPHIDISITRRPAPPVPPMDSSYGQYKSTVSMTTPNPTHHNHLPAHSAPSSYSQLSSTTLTSTNPLQHHRQSAIGGSPVNTAAAAGNLPYLMTKERIYDHQKYSSSSLNSSAKVAYNSAATTNSNINSTIYDSHPQQQQPHNIHHNMNNQAMSKTLPIDHHVINPSNMPTSKEQHPSPNYARKCPQMYTPEEQSTAHHHHHHLYMSTPQFSSDKFTRASPQQAPPPLPPPPPDFNKLRESPSASSYMHQQQQHHQSNDKYNSATPQQLRESPQYPQQSSLNRNHPHASYYAAAATSSSASNQNPSKIHPPEMSPIIMKQTPTHHYQQYSKSSLAPPPLPQTSAILPPSSHLQHQPSLIPPPPPIGKRNENSSLAPPISAQLLGTSSMNTPQRYLMDNVKREDLDYYETSNHTVGTTRRGMESSGGGGSGIYINPYNTPPPTGGDNCCKDVAALAPSSSSSPYNTMGSVTPSYHRVESPQFYPTKYGKLTAAAASMSEISPKQHHSSLINQNTPPPSRAPSSQRGLGSQQQPANYYYEGNSHSAPSPAAATAASPSPSSVMTTTTPQTQMQHHTEYITTIQSGGPPPPPLPSLVGASSHNMTQHQSYPTHATSAQHHQQQSLTASLRNESLHTYERGAGHHQVPVPLTGMPAKHMIPQAPPINSNMHTMQTGPPQGSSMNSSKNLTSKHQKPNYRELINQKLAMRNATTEEELNMQIIKKTLNVDNPPPIRGATSGQAQSPMGTQRSSGIHQASAVIRDPLRPELTINSSPKVVGGVAPQPSSSVLVTHSATLPLTNSSRLVEVVPLMETQRISIKQEEDKPTSSTSATTASSPLDLSMRTVKTKADSTEYKYQQRQRLPITSNVASSSTERIDGHYTLPRVDSSPIFSVHAFEPAQQPTSNRSHNATTTNSRHNSLDRRNYTPPTQMSGSSLPAASYNHTTSPHIPASSQLNYATSPARRNEVASSFQSPHEKSMVIKSAMKTNLNQDLAYRPSHTNSPTQSRPSVLETNPYASVIKTEPKQRILDGQQPTAPLTSIQQHPLSAVERLPPDTSIMALPPRNPYNIQPPQTITTSNIGPPPSNYTLACEKNPNFLGRKRHLQEYSQQQMSLQEPVLKQQRYMELPKHHAPPSATKNPIAMRPADISVIAVNDSNRIIDMDKNLLKQTEFMKSPAKNLGVIASSNNATNVIVANHHQTTTTPPSAMVVCKQEPLTPTAEAPPVKLTENHINSNQINSSSSSARIRTKAELKGFTFNPPPPTLNTNTTTTTATEMQKPTTPTPICVPNEELIIKQEPELPPIIKIKQELPSQIEMPSIPGLNDEFKEDALLDFGWSNTCNNFVEQLQTRPAPKKKLTAISKNLKEIPDNKLVLPSNDITPVLAAANPKKESNFSNMESADNTTRSSFTRLEAGVESSLTLNTINQDSITSQNSVGLIHKKLTKAEREKKRFQQEQRLAERLQAKESSSETEDELDKRKTERMKKPLMKAKHKIKSPQHSPNTNQSNNNSSNTQTDKNHFSECGSDSSTTTTTNTTNTTDKNKDKDKDKDKDKTPTTKNTPEKLETKVEIKLEKEKEPENSLKKQEIIKDDKKKEQPEKCDKIIKPDKTTQQEQQQQQQPEKKKESLDKTKKSLNIINNKTEKVLNKKESPPQKPETKKLETKKSSQSDDEEDEEEEHKKEQNTKLTTPNKGKLTKLALNTMTRSKRKKELELQLANAKVLRNDKVIRNPAATGTNSNATIKIKRKYTIRSKYNTVNNLLESGGLSRESGVMKSTRLKAKLERNGNKLNLLKNNKNKTNNLTNKKDASTTSTLNKLKNDKNCQNPENVHERNVIDLYRFKRALKVPPSLINIKHPGAHKIAASLPDLERHAEALEAYAKKRKKGSLKSSNTKIKNEPSSSAASSSGNKKNAKDSKSSLEEPKSIIDLLHSRVTKSSGLNVHNKTTTTTAFKPLKPSCTTTTMTSNTTKTPNLSTMNITAPNCAMFSETSQTTESSELQMLPELKKDSEEDEENDDNESTNGNRKRHFSIFDTKVLATKTRTESKLQQKKENIREIFVGDDRPASAPPEMIQSLDCSVEKMTYEQKYEQFLQQMNIVISADKFGRFGRSAAAKKLLPPHLNSQDLSSVNIKQEEIDTESTSVIDADELKSESMGSNHLRKKRGKYLRRKGSSGFDYIRKKKKPTPASSTSNNQFNNGSLSNLPHFSIKSEKLELDEYEHKIKTEDDVSREIQKWVLNKGVGQSTMHKAARQGYIDVIVYCLDRMGMNPDQKDNAGYTPLHEACTNGWLNIARVLLQYGANHSEAAHSGIRPLHEASENDHEEIVRLLLSFGADPLLATYSGQTPLMLASSKTMRDILNNHLVDVQSMGPERKPWRFNGAWEIYDPSECGYNVFEGAPNFVCDMSRALLRKCSLTNNQMFQNKKLQVLNTNTLVKPTTSLGGASTSSMATTSKTLSNTTCNNSSMAAKDSQTTNSSSTSTSGLGGGGSSSSSGFNSNNASSSSSILGVQQGIDTPQQQKQQIKGETTTKTVMDKCAVVLDNIDRFNSVRLNNDNNKSEILVENSDSDGEMFEFEEADVLLPPLYLLKDEGTQDKWVLLSDLCNLLKVKSKDTLLNKIYPSSSSTSSVASAHKSLMRELKMSDFLEKATCLQLLCAGEKLNICASKVVLIKYNENVRNLLGVKTILMKF